MRYFWLAVAFVCTFCFAQPNAHAESPAAAPRAVSHAIRVAIHCSCSDAVGQSYIAAVKNLLGQNAEYRLVDANHSGEEGVLAINVISMPVDASDGRPKSVLSIVCTHDGSMVHQFIETCDRIPLADCAKSMVDGLRDVL